MAGADATDSSKILLHLCAQLFHKANNKANGDGVEQIVLKKRCNEAVEAAKANLKEPENIPPGSMAVPALKSLFTSLKEIYGRPIVVFIDALNECLDEQEFLTTLESLKAYVLISSRSSLNTKCIMIDEAKATKHIRLYVSDTLNRQQLPFWNSATKGDAVRDVVRYSRGTFKCK